MIQPPLDNKARFLSKVDRNGPTPSHCPELGPCWIWKAGRSSKGYGYYFMDGKTVGAHRCSYEFTFGAIPDGLLVCHKCDRTSCVRPDHLFLGTSKQNSNDAKDKGRLNTARGTSHPFHKLTDADVIEMRRLHAHEGYGYKKLKKRFGISCGGCKRIVKGLRWRHI